MLLITVAEFAAITVFFDEPQVGTIIFVIEKLVLIPLVVWSAVNLRKLQKAGKAVAEGDLEYKTDTNHLFGDFKRFGEDMNRISDGRRLRSGGGDPALDQITAVERAVPRRFCRTDL